MGMVCQTCRLVGVQVDEAYKCSMTGEGRSYQERQRESVQFTECGKDIARGSLAIHRQTHHRVSRGGAGKKDYEGDGDGGDDTRMFRMTFP